MRIAVIGTGNIGSTLGRSLAAAGHEVRMGSRHPDDVHVDGAVAVGVAEALRDVDAVLLAVPASAVGDLLAEHGGGLDGVLVLDATNRMGAPVMNAAAEISAAAPGARYVRAFNSYGWENFAQPVFDGLAADLFFSAAEADRAVVEDVITSVGLRPAYLGEGQQDVVDRITAVWFALTRTGGSRHVALRVLTD
jgi:8-hydroxy-5-deazaflavin:NADPH oxidoreductase